MNETNERIAPVQHIKSVGCTDFFQVESASGDLPHVVSVEQRFAFSGNDADWVRCDCKGYRFGKRCRHTEDVRRVFAPQSGAIIAPAVTGTIATNQRAWQDDPEPPDAPDYDDEIICPFAGCGRECERLEGETSDELHCQNCGLIDEKDYEVGR